MLLDRFMLFLIIVTIAAIILASWSFMRLFTIKLQLNSLIQLLNEIEVGNGNHRITTPQNSLLEPLCNKFNDIIYHYEHHLTQLQMADTWNRQLISGMSNDFQAPLTALVKCLDAIQTDEILSKEQRHYLEVSKEKSHILKQYLDTFLDWFEMNIQELAWTITPLDLGETTRNLLKNWIPVFEEKQLHYDINIPDIPMTATVDFTRYTQILNHLIHNVLVYSRATEIQLAVLKKEGDIEIRVSDNGIGIPKRELQFLLEHKETDDSTYFINNDHLSLPHLKNIIRKMGGTFIAQSKAYEKTVFIVRFPRVQDL